MNKKNGGWCIINIFSHRVGWIGLWLLTVTAIPTGTAAQVEVSTGVLVVPKPSVGGTQVGPVLSVGASWTVLRIPFLVEVSVARTDFTSLGQDYHHNHYVFTVGAEWFPTRGKTRPGLRLGLGAYGEYEIVETNPRSPGGDNWVEALAPGLVLERDIGEGRQLFVGFTDFILGPYFAIFDPGEYSVEHRLRLVLGIRF